MVRATFVMEQHIGHYTYYQNLRRFLETHPHVDATWISVTYHEDGGVWERLSFLPQHIRGTLRGRSQVRQGLRHGSADVFFFNTQVPAALGGWLSMRRPYVIATDLTPIQYDQLGKLYGHRADRPGPVQTYKHHVNTRLLRSAARLLPWSHWAGASLIDDYGVEPRKVDVIPPGVDLAQWTPCERRVEGPLRILFVGGDLHRKGGKHLLQAFRELPRGSAELHLVTRSVTPREEGLISYHDLQPNTPRLVELYRSSHVFVLPTEAEAFGIAAVEASATGLPVIANAVGGLTDIVVDGETGYLLQPGDVRGLTDRLRLLAEDVGLRDRLGRAARARAEAYFDARQNATRVAEVLVAAAQSVS